MSSFGLPLEGSAGGSDGLRRLGWQYPHSTPSARATAGMSAMSGACARSKEESLPMISTARRPKVPCLTVQPPTWFKKPAHRASSERDVDSPIRDCLCGGGRPVHPSSVSHSSDELVAVLMKPPIRHSAWTRL